MVSGDTTGSSLDARDGSSITRSEPIDDPQSPKGLPAMLVGPPDATVGLPGSAGEPNADGQAGVTPNSSSSQSRTEGISTRCV